MSTATSDGQSRPDATAALQALHDKLTAAIAQLASAEGWQQMLRLAAALPSYSAHNVLLITSQRPGATAVAGFHTWKQLGRSVREGEKGIGILAPVVRRTAEPQRQTPVEGAAGEHETVDKPDPGRRVTGFRVVHVFDISQTSGPDLPSLPEPVLLDGQAPAGLLDGLTAHVHDEGYQLIRHDFDIPHPGLGSPNGVTDFLARTVIVRPDLSDAQTAKTLGHELGHVLLHAPGRRPPDLTRPQAEVEAESVALPLIWTIFIVFARPGRTAVVQRRVVMRVQVLIGASGQDVQLVDDEGSPVEAAAGYLAYLSARGCSPNTVRGYAYDLLHLWRFLQDAGLGWAELRPRSSIELLTFLRSEPARSKTQRLTLSAVGPPGVRTLSASTINRILTGIGGFYTWAIASEQFDGANPIERRPDPAWRRVTDRHQPFTGEASRQRSERRVLKVRQPRRLPRPLSEEQVDALFAKVTNLRDRAMLQLMLNGGLRPGEVLSLHLEDIAYGRRRVFVRVRDDHPGGARPKSRSERVVDLFEVDTLAAISDYVMTHRPAEAASPFVFLVGGNGARRCEPLSYAALVRLFARAAARADIREPWVTPHALRHTHATRMWEGGMRELTLQRRLGHSSVESTRLYTRVADHEVAADYLRALGQDGDRR